MVIAVIFLFIVIAAQPITSIYIKKYYNYNQIEKIKLINDIDPRKDLFEKIIQITNNHDLKILSEKPLVRNIISIQEMIDNANPGDTIIIPPGVYNEHIHITKPLTLQGTNKTNTKITFLDDYCQIIFVDQPNVTIRNLDINNKYGDFGVVWQWNAPTGLIENCILHVDTLGDDKYGIALYTDASGLTIRDCDFYDCSDEMIAVSLKYPVNDLLIENCTFHDMHHPHTAIEIQTGNNITIKNCSFTDIPSSFVIGMAMKKPIKNVIIDGCELKGDSTEQVFQIINTLNITISNSYINGKSIGIRINSNAFFEYCVFVDDISCEFEDYSTIVFNCPVFMGDVVWFVENTSSYVIRTCPFASIKGMYSTPIKPSYGQAFTITVDVDNTGDLYDYLWCKIYKNSQQVYSFITNNTVSNFTFIYNSNGITTKTVFTALTGHGADIYNQYDDSKHLTVYLIKPYANHITKIISSIINTITILKFFIK